ncbi:MAG: TMEM175 family protein [Acidobacteriota bacterium]
MNTTRLEAFSDAVIAIIMTIMVLELKVPHGTDLASLTPVMPTFFGYLLSFVYLGIYWNNHHHMLHATSKVNGAILWANLNLLFWLSLFPFATSWIGENHVESTPVAVYGGLLLMAAISYTILQTTIVRFDKNANALLAQAIGSDLKGKISMVCYAAAIPLAFFNSWISIGLFVLVAMIWLVPDRRIEKKLSE